MPNNIFSSSVRDPLNLLEMAFSNNNRLRLFGYRRVLV
jgi:hypothetical protein